MAFGAIGPSALEHGCVPVQMRCGRPYSSTGGNLPLFLPRAEIFAHFRA